MLWFTGLPCSGKTTLANELYQKLSLAGHPVERLDGDDLRKTLCKDLGFSREDRDENVSRIAALASSLVKDGAVALVSIVSPYRQMRQRAREIIDPFVEVYVRCSLEECERRDVKGMYRLARQGKIQNFTGVTDPYEEPLKPEVVVNTEVEDVPTCVKKIMDHLVNKGLTSIAGSV